MLTVGVLLGLGAAFLQAAAYLLSRRFAVREGRSAMQLLVMSHVMQGVVCIPAAIMLWPATMPPVWTWGRWVLLSSGAYLVAQTCLFLTLRTIDASRISPLLGMKVAAVAILNLILFREALLPAQWAAVGMMATAAFALNYTGGALPWTVVATVLTSCLGYAISDLSIVAFIDEMEGMSVIAASSLVLCLVYIVSAAVGVIALRWLPNRGWRSLASWRAATPYAATWLVGMILLFASFAAAGVVLANMMQSTRGLMSILLGAVVAWAGHEHVERKVSRSVLGRRVVAAGAMAIAIGVFVAAPYFLKSAPDATTWSSASSQTASAAAPVRRWPEVDDANPQQMR